MEDPKMTDHAVCSLDVLNSIAKKLKEKSGSMLSQCSAVLWISAWWIRHNVMLLWF